MRAIWAMGGSACLAVLCCVGLGRAQDVTKAASEEVIVTGTRLKSPDVTLYPTTTIGGDEIERRGITNVLDAVRTDPATGLGASPAGAQAGLGTGSAFVDLFDLGSQRTLTLIDGKRVVSGNQATLFGQAATGLQVDFNIVPTALIDRIDIVSVGGAPSYGADAIGGTVNVVLKRDYEGAEIDSLYGQRDSGFGEQWRVRGLYGRNFDEGRGNVTLSLERSSQNGFTNEVGSYLRHQYALAPNPLNSFPFNTDPEPNGVFNNYLFEDFRIPSVTTGGAILRAPGLPTYLTPAGRAFLLANPEIAASHPEFALANSALPFTALASRLATAAEIAAGARAPDDNPFGAPRVAAPLQFAPDGAIVPQDVGLIAADEVLSGVMASGGDGLNLAPLTALQSSVDRKLANARARYQIDSHVSAYADLLYAEIIGVEPANQPAFNGAVFGGTSASLGFRGDNPFLSEQARALLTDPSYNFLDATVANVSWTAPNSIGAFGGCLVPGMPADIAAGCPLPVAGTKIFYTSRAYTDLIGLAPSRTESRTARGVLGLDGDMELFGRAWSFDTSLNYGYAKAENRNISIAQAQFNAARDVVGSDDAITCRVNSASAAERTAVRFAFRYTNVPPAAGAEAIDPNTPAPPPGFYRRSVGDPLGASEAVLDACQPLNLFGDQASSQEARNYVAAPLLTSNVNEQFVYEANLAGPVASLPAGDIQLALGASYRYEQTSFRADNDIARYGLARAVAYQEIDGASFSSTEFYGEALVPLLGKGFALPLVHRLTLNGSYRWLDNDQAGEDSAWTYGLAWSPIEPVTLRAARTRSVRSPSLTEYFVPASSTFQGAEDPCDARSIDGGDMPSIRRANCVAEAARLGFTGLSTFNSLVTLAPVQGQLTGNPELASETSDAETYGVTVRTDALLGDLEFSADFVKVDVEGSIESLGLNQIMRACYDNPVFPNPFCERFVRLSGTSFRPFQIDFGSATAPAFTTTYVNVGNRVTQAVTASASWTVDLADLLATDEGDLGTLNVRFVYTYLDRLRIDVTGEGTAIDIQDGEIGRPTNEHQLTLTYFKGPLTLVGIWQHQGEAVFDRQALTENRAQTGVDAYDIFNGVVLYDITETVQGRLVVNNIFDTGPPFGSGSIAYDQAGRAWQVGLKLRF